MQIIQNIRDKGAAIVIAVIALSLIGFILMDAQQGSSNLFRSMSSKIGKVNGEAIELNEFNERVRQLEEQEEARSQQKLSLQRINQIRQQLWDQMVAEKIFFKESAKLGLDLSAKELNYILYSNDPINPLLQEQSLVDPTSKKLNVAEVQKALTNVKKLKGEQRDAIMSQLVNPIRLSNVVSKYSAFISAAAYYPTWMQNKDKKERNEFAQIKYVTIPFSDISDSTIKVTDDDVTAYVKKHKDLFKQEAGRNLSYVSFSQLPSTDDSLAVVKMLQEIKPAFQSDTNAQAFIARNTSVKEYEDVFKPKSKFSLTNIDSIVKAPVNAVSGPFAEQGSIVLAKVVATKPLPDSVKAKHILISFNQQGITDSSAKAKADSILAAVNAGADFGAMAAQFSADGSKDKGGDLGMFSWGQMVPEFNEFTFNKPVGTRGVVRTQFGYHVIEITEQKNFLPAYKIALMAKDITPSEATINAASLAATKAAGMKDAKELSAYVAKNGLSLTQVPALIKENDFSVGALTDARQLVQWAFKAKKGDVSEAFSIGDQFVVAVVEKIFEEGVQDAATARPGAEPIIRNEKKSETILKKLGNAPTLESAAAAYNKTIGEAGADSSLTMNAQVINGIGVEPKLVGASFNKSYKTKASPAFAGNSGVFVMQILNHGNKVEETPDVTAQQNTNRINTLRGQSGNWYEGLKKMATIKDTRSEHF